VGDCRLGDFARSLRRGGPTALVATGTCMELLGDIMAQGVLGIDGVIDKA
jgi:hypothetical protein